MRFDKAVFWNFINLTVPAVASFAIISLIGKGLDTGDFGIYNYIFRFVTIVSYVFVSIFMFVYSYYFNMEQNSRQKGEIFYTFMTLLSCVSLVLLVVMLPVWPYILPHDVKEDLVFIGGVFLLLLYVMKGGYSEAFNSLFEFRKRVYLELFKNMVWLTLIVVIYFLEDIALAEALLAAAAAHILYLLAAHLTLKRIIGGMKMPGRNNFRQAMSMIKHKTGYFTIATTLNSLVTLIVMTMLGMYYSSVEIGIFSYGYLFAFFFTMAGAAITNTILPYTTSLERAKVETYMWTSFYGSLYLFLPVIVVLSFFFDQIMSLVFNRSFVGRTEQVSFILLMLALSLKSTSGTPGSVLNGYGYTKENFIISFIMVLASFSAGLFLIPRYEIIGAAGTLLLVYTAQFFLNIYFLDRKGFALRFYSPYMLYSKLKVKLSVMYP